MAVVPLPFNGAGSHLPSWNSKLLGREWGGEEGHTHTHKHTLPLTLPVLSSLGLETLVETTSLPRPPPHTHRCQAWRIK